MNIFYFAIIFFGIGCGGILPVWLRSLALMLGGDGTIMPVLIGSCSLVLLSIMSLHSSMTSLRDRVFHGPRNSALFALIVFIIFTVLTPVIIRAVAWLYAPLFNVLNATLSGLIIAQSIGAFVFFAVPVFAVHFGFQAIRECIVSFKRKEQHVLSAAGVFILSAAFGFALVGFMVLPHMDISIIAVLCGVSILPGVGLLWLYRGRALGVRTLPAGEHTSASDARVQHMHVSDTSQSPEIHALRQQQIIRIFKQVSAFCIGVGMTGTALLVWYLGNLVGGTSWGITLRILVFFITGVGVGWLVRSIAFKKNNPTAHIESAVVLISILTVFVSLLLLRGIPVHSVMYLNQLFSEMNQAAAMTSRNLMMPFFYVWLTYRYALIIIIPAFVWGLMLGQLFCMPHLLRDFISDAMTVRRKNARMFLLGTVFGVCGIALCGVAAIGSYYSFISAVGILGIAAILNAFTRTTVIRIQKAIFPFVILIVFLCLIIIIPSDIRLMAIGAFNKAPELQSQAGELLEQRPWASDTLLHRAALLNRRFETTAEEFGTAFTIIDEASENNAVLLENGYACLASRNDVVMQQLLAHIPLLLHKQPTSVLVAGSGLGITLGSAGLYKLKTITYLSPSYHDVALQKEYFDLFSYKVWSDERLKIRYGTPSAIHYLGEKYDSIIMRYEINALTTGAELSYSVLSGIHERMSDDGYVCVLLPMYDINNTDIKSFIQTFISVFDHAALFQAHYGSEYILMGADIPIEFDLPQVQRRLDTMTLQTVLALNKLNSVESIISTFICADADLRAWAGEGAIIKNTGIRAAYQMPLSLYKRATADELRDLFEHRSRVLNYISPSSGDEKYMRLLRSIDRVWEHEGRLIELTGILDTMNSIDRMAPDERQKEYDHLETKMYNLCSELIEVNPANYSASQVVIDRYYFDAQMMRRLGNTNEMIQRYKDIANIDPTYKNINIKLARHYFGLIPKDTEKYGPLCQKYTILANEYNRRCNNFNIREIEAMVYYQVGMPDVAISKLEALSRETDEGFHFDLQLGDIYLRSGDKIQAREYYQKTLQRDPHNVDALLRLAELDLTAGNAKTAQRRCVQALRYDPANVQAYQLLKRL